MATAQDVLNRALKFAGKVTEDPPGSNRNRFTEQYGLNFQPWCLMFCWCILTDCHVPMLKTAYTPTAAEYFKDAGTGFVKDQKAKPGDLVFFDFPDSLSRIQHVGFVVKNTGTGLLTVEGNTSSGIAGSQDDGGGVFERKRGYSEAVYYGRPPYEKAELPEFEVPEARTWFGKGDSGADVRAWQIDLNRWVRNLKHRHFDFHLKPTGKFDFNTVSATVTFQSKYALDATGRVGVATIRKMEQIRERQKAA